MVRGVRGSREPFSLRYGWVKPAQFRTRYLDKSCPGHNLCSGCSPQHRLSHYGIGTFCELMRAKMWSRWSKYWISGTDILELNDLQKLLSLKFKAWAQMWGMKRCWFQTTGSNKPCPRNRSRRSLGVWNQKWKTIFVSWSVQRKSGPGVKIMFEVRVMRIPILYLFPPKFLFWAPAKVPRREGSLCTQLRVG